MFKIALRLFLLNLIFILARPASAGPAVANHIEKFELQECSSFGCFKSKGKVGHLSFFGDIISSKAVTLEVFSDLKSKPKIFHCESYRYDFLAKFVLCDNRKLKSVPSVTLDSKFKISEYSF